LASPISIARTDSEIERLAAAASVRDLTDEEVARFAALLGKLLLLAPVHPAAAAILERENVTHAIWELGHRLTASD
jgi:hypothetical protein